MKIIEGEIWEFINLKVIKDRLSLFIKSTLSTLADVDPEKTILT